LGDDRLVSSDVSRISADLSHAIRRRALIDSALPDVLESVGGIALPTIRGAADTLKNGSKKCFPYTRGI